MLDAGMSKDLLCGLAKGLAAAENWIHDAKGEKFRTQGKMYCRCPIFFFLLWILSMVKLQVHQYGCILKFETENGKTDEAG